MYNNEKNNKIDELENMATKFKNAFVNMTAQMNEIKSAKGDEDSTEKVKDLKKQIKELNKELNESKEKKNEALKKMKEETNKRAKLEADNTALRRQM